MLYVALLYVVSFCFTLFVIVVTDRCGHQRQRRASGREQLRLRDRAVPFLEEAHACARPLGLPPSVQGDEWVKIVLI